MNTKQQYGLCGRLARVVTLYPERFPTDAFGFGTIDGEHWYGVPIGSKPGMEADFTDGSEQPKLLPMSCTLGWLRRFGRLEEER